MGSQAETTAPSSENMPTDECNHGKQVSNTTLKTSGKKSGSGLALAVFIAAVAIVLSWTSQRQDHEGRLWLVKLLRNNSLEGSIDVLSEQGLLTIENLREVPDVHVLAEQIQFRTTAERAHFLRMTSTLQQGAAEAGVPFAMTRKEALEHAISLGHVNKLSMWDTLMSRTGLGPSVPGGVASLHDAAANGDVAKIEMLVRAGVPVGGQREAPVASDWLIGPSALFGSVSSNPGAAKSGRTSLHTAAEHDSITAINALLGCGADIAATDKFFRTALHVAAASNSRAALVDLVHLGASVEAKDKHGATALHAAASGDAADAARELLQGGAKTEARLDKGGRTPLHAAAVAGAGAAVKALVEGGAKLEAADDIGITPLFLSAIVGKPASFEALVAAGADMNVKDSDGKTIKQRTREMQGSSHPIMETLDQYACP